jgi:hypothetical protein
MAAMFMSLANAQRNTIQKIRNPFRKVVVPFTEKAKLKSTSGVPGSQNKPMMSHPDIPPTNRWRD